MLTNNKNQNKPAHNSNQIIINEPPPQKEGVPPIQQPQTIRERKLAAIANYRQLKRTYNIVNTAKKRRISNNKTPTSERAKKLQKMGERLSKQDEEELFKPLQIPDNMSQEQIQRHLNYEDELQFRKEHFRMAHSLLNQELVSVCYNEDTITNYAMKLIQTKDHKPYYGISPFNCCLEEKFLEAIQIFEAYDIRLLSRHLPETIELARKHEIAWKTLLRGVNYVLSNINHSINTEQGFAKSCAAVH